MSNEIEWAESPAEVNRKWNFIIEQLNERPGAWSSIGRMSISTAYMYSKQYGLELRLGVNDGSQADVYFRVAEQARTLDDVTAASPFLALAGN